MVMGGLGTTGAATTVGAGFGTSSSSVRSIRELSTAAGAVVVAGLMTLLAELDGTIEGVGRPRACMPVGVGFA